VQEFVQRYYGEVLEKSGDLKTNACARSDASPEHVTAALAEIHEEVREVARYYGCGLVLPEALEAACENYDQTVTYNGSVPVPPRAVCSG
jgi:arsenite methyltransferase